MVVGGGGVGGQYRLLLCLMAARPGMLRARHDMWVRISSSPVSKVVGSVGLFVCRETLLHWGLTGCGKCDMRLHPDYERVAVGVTRVRGSGENSCN